MTKTKGKNPVEINHLVSVGDSVDAYFDGVGLWLTAADSHGGMSHIGLDASCFEQVLRCARDRVGGDFAALVAKVGREP